ncbi:ABC transporter ATP-binding protein [Myxococcota bacterium]|nr:ABC transporter ATP-binding protein [Myxococcota bacterium]MBU1536165.1 ABC transporter ATP-binding protein [Myxococcota bacterium]
MSKPKTIIKISKVSKFYGSGSAKQQVLHDININIYEGDFISIVGTSGSGKTTLLNIIGGLDRRYEGTCLVDGHNVEKLNERRLARMRNETLGFIFQSFNLMEHLTAWENVALSSFFAGTKIPLGKEYARATEVLEKVGLKDKINAYPANLSGGQKQRVAIARALYNKPRLLLCDEPTGNLDSKTGEEVIDLFKALNREDKITLLVITHEDRVSKTTDRSIQLEDGRIVSTDSKNAPVH